MTGSGHTSRGSGAQTCHLSLTARESCRPHPRGELKVKVQELTARQCFLTIRLDSHGPSP